ncbi:MAG TPA: TrkA C-terminal domain-containing protein, partial [Aquabacterium sp.]|nr:TrkA C-terminal domain-containing protein [Aquabacterium sp.]
TWPSVPAALKILALVHQQAPQVPVVVRTIDESGMDALQAAGASAVVPEAIEGSLMLASQALALVGVPMRRVIRLVQDQRIARYGLLRDYFHGADDDSVDELDLQRLQAVTLGEDAACIGLTLGELPPMLQEVAVVSLRRAEGAVLHASPGLRLHAGDTLVLSGRPQALSRAEHTLVNGAP